MNKKQIIEKLQAGHELYNRGSGWWLSSPKRASGAADAVKIDDDLMNVLERDGTLRIVMLTRSMRAELPVNANDAESIAKRRWNVAADEMNQWDMLGEDEKAGLVAAVVAEKSDKALPQLNQKRGKQPMSIDYATRCEMAKKVKPGDVWRHRKTGKLAEVVAVHGMDIELLHESGRVSRKQDHYFASDFEPNPQVKG